jgi:hypothetical protein
MASVHFEDRLTCLAFFSGPLISGEQKVINFGDIGILATQFLRKTCKLSGCGAVSR